MRLLIISHTEHFRQGDRFVGWGPTVREIDHLATLFGSVVHVAPVYPREAPKSSLPYNAPNVTVRPVAPAGGNGFRQKLGILRAYPSYFSVIHRELARADVAHIRCPANISMLGLLALSANRGPKLRWVKYAGNWQPEGGEAWSYRFQRWWLRHNLHRGVVTINGVWDGQPPHVHSFVNPCLSEEELQEGRRLAENKVMERPLRLLFVGDLSTAKGVHLALKALRLTLDRGAEASMEFIGDGRERAAFEQMARDLNLCDAVQFHGWVPRSELSAYYGRAHLLMLPSKSEGWPKVLSEAMAFGVVPLASTVSSIPQYLSEAQTGRAIPAEAVEQYADAALEYASCPEMWKRELQNGLTAAERFSYRRYLEAVRALLGLESAPTAAESNI